MTALPEPPTEAEARALCAIYREHPARCPFWGAFPLRSPAHRAAVLEHVLSLRANHSADAIRDAELRRLETYFRAAPIVPHKPHPTKSRPTQGPRP